MTVALMPMGAAELALRLMARRGRGDWAVLVVEPVHDASQAAEELAQEMAALGDADVVRVQGARDALDLCERIAPARGPVVIWGLDSWQAPEWSHLDHLRSRLARDERTALVVSAPAFDDIMRHAPNFSSWLGASVWTYRPRAEELTEEEQDRRLAALQAWSGLSNEEVIARAEARTLPSDPEYAEWLMLLDRGDLLER
ncbi:hypothetical protein WME90_32990 [Sorangium sp. So ce375]|uniref:hypothetical protein n=1 Tax=Sorangium sp. So ce375 TaxID=3133306 RepID=UPI003F5B5FA4